MKTRLYLSLICGLVFGLTSCETNLNPEPSTSVSDKEMFSSLEYAQTVLNAAHAQIGDYLNHTLYYVMADVMGEDATCTDDKHGFQTYNWQKFSYTYSQIFTEAGGWWAGYANRIWAGQYAALDGINSIIAYCPENLPESAERDELVAKARGLRGYVLLQLIRLFAPAYNIDSNDKGIVLRLEPANASSDHMPRCTIAEAYDQVVEDLTFAVDNITNTSADYLTSKSSALLLARAYLDMNDFANAEKYADIAASNTYDGSNLMSQDEWTSGFIDTSNFNETLWYQNYNATTSNLYVSMGSYYYLAVEDTKIAYGGKSDYKRYSETGEGFVNPKQGYSTLRFTFDFVNMFNDGDCRKLFPFYFYEEDGYFTSKLRHRAGSVLGDHQYPMARIAEAYLIKAECDAHLESEAAAATTLNALQAKRGATETDGSLENIYKERRKELYCEGQRLFDIKRLRQPLDRSAAQHWAIKEGLPADSPRFMLPIPECEINYNNMISQEDQNEYWR